MPRIPYLPQDISEPRELVDTIRARRRGELLNLDRMLLHSPPFAQGWNNLLREVRAKLSLPARLHELTVCAVASLNAAEYEFFHHGPEFIKAGGSKIELEQLRNFDGNLDKLTEFSAEEKIVLQLATEMTRQIKVSDTTFAAVKKVLPNDQHITELIGVIATYNMVSRYLVALEIEPEQHTVQD